MTRNTHRFISERWVIKGTLELTSPTHFGNGGDDSFTDMPILLNEVDGNPLLPGTSIAGALRNYLRELESGFGKPAPSAKDLVERNLYATLLFGGYRGDDEGSQSPLVVHDSVGTLKEMELRDGVSINAERRTAEDDQKFDIQLLSAGTTFDLTFELSFGNPNDAKSPKVDREKLLKGLALALEGFSNSQITLGARKRRGYGLCKVEKWSVMYFDLKDPKQFLSWLAYGHDGLKSDVIAIENSQIAAALGISQPTLDERKLVTLEATFALDGTLLIRSGFGESDTGPDSVHLHSKRGDTRVPVIPGTSWAGVLRHRAFKIARTVWGKDNTKCKELVEGMFGPSEVDDDNGRASRITIAESEVWFKLASKLIALQGGHLSPRCLLSSHWLAHRIVK
jgi:CRISPR/Cas system CSM-associated protein Csm3 (group 7 of RAMP superfamily)